MERLDSFTDTWRKLTTQLIGTIMLLGGGGRGGGVSISRGADVNTPGQ